MRRYFIIAIKTMENERFYMISAEDVQPPEEKRMNVFLIE